jgi:CRP/FNR family transcriptional regulator
MTSPSCLTCKTRGCSLLNNCSDAVLKEISDKKIFRKLKKGEKIFAEGKEALNIAFVRSGVIKVELNGKKNRPLIMRLAKEGDILGHRMADNNSRYPVTMVAVENAQVCLLASTHFQHLMDNCSDFRKQIIKAYLQEMRETEMKTIHLVHKTVKEKIAGILLHIADVYKYLQQSNGIHIHLTRQEMADLSGTTKEQVSKILADFKKEKLINFRAKHFKFFDLVKLETIAALA